MRHKKKQRAPHGASKSLRRLCGFFRPYLLAFWLGVFMILAACIFGALAPILEGSITTHLAEDVFAMANGTATGVRLEFILKTMLTLGGIYLAGTLANLGYNFLLTRSIQHAMRDLRNKVEGKIRFLPVGYFDRNSFGDLLSRVTNDVDTLSNALQQSLAQIVNAVLMLTFAIVMMFTINAIMAVVALIIIPLSLWATKIIVGRSQKLFMNQQNALGRMNGAVQEMYTGFSEISLYGRQKKAVESFKEVNDDLCANGFKAQFVSGLLSPLISLITYLGIAIIAVTGAFYAASGVIQIGHLQAFVRYIWQINQPLSQVSQLSGAIQSAFAAMSRIFSFLDEPEETPDPKNAMVPQGVHGEIVFSHLRFGYSPDRILIRDLNLRVRSGQMVAIVGPTGAGKTTLVNLLMRFYDPLEGSILIDGVDIRQMSRSGLRSLFAMVLQDTWLFHGTIRENIEYGRFGASFDEVVDAAKCANVHHFIKTLDGGYNMLIDEEASNVSLGEKQLLTIARAMLSDPAILILDEATSSVDTRLELMLQTAMKKIMQGRTSFVIAHRLSTIRNADLILVMNDGEIVEQGTHEELMAQAGFYQSLYNSQFVKG